MWDHIGHRNRDPLGRIIVFLGNNYRFLVEFTRLKIVNCTLEQRFELLRN